MFVAFARILRANIIFRSVPGIIDEIIYRGIYDSKENNFIESVKKRTFSHSPFKNKKASLFSVNEI